MAIEWLKLSSHQSNLQIKWVLFMSVTASSDPDKLKDENACVLVARITAGCRVGIYVVTGNVLCMISDGSVNEIAECKSPDSSLVMA